MDNRTAINPLQQAAELLERSQQLLRAATAETVPATTAARVRRMPLAQLRRDPVLWAAYNRGWDDRTAVFRRATELPPAETNRSRSPRRPVQPAGTPRPPPMPVSAQLFRPPLRPLMETPVPRPRTSVNQTPTPPTAAAMAIPAAETTTAATATTMRTTPLNARQRRNQARLREFKHIKRTIQTANNAASQQFRLAKPITPVDPPSPSTQPREEATPPVAEATAPEVEIPTGTAGTSEPPTTTTSTPEDMEISPEEEAELLADTDVVPPEDVDMETVYDNAIHALLHTPTSPQPE